MKTTSYFRMMFFVAFVGFVFSTKAQTGIATAPYNCGFENAMENAYWRFYNTTYNRWAIDTATQCSGQKSMYVSNNNGLSNAYTPEAKTITAYRSVALVAGQYTISYDYKMGYSGAVQRNVFMRAMLVPDTVQLPGDSLMYVNLCNNVLPQGAIPIDSGWRYSTSDVWKTFRDDYVLVNNTGTYKLVFVWVPSTYNYTTFKPAAIDNISIVGQSCITPDSLTATVVGDSIKVDWTDLGNTPPSNGWLVEYRPLGGHIATARYMNTNSRPCYLPRTSLTPNTQYEIRVAAMCSASDTSLFTQEAIVNYRLYQPIGRLVYDTLTASHVKCTYGQWRSSGLPQYRNQGPYQYVGVVDSGSSNYLKSRHTVHRNPMEKDSCTGYVLPTIYRGSSIYSAFHQQIKYTASVRLGKLRSYNDAQSISYQMHVDTNAADLMMINYAFVENLSNHNTTQNYPHLVIEILDTNDQVIDLVADLGNVGFLYNSPYNLATNTYYTNWNQLAVNMAPYQGRDVRLSFVTYTCGTCVDVSTYAYLIPDYRNASLVSLENNNKDNTTTFAAPEGYYRYKWYLLSNPSVYLDTVHQVMSIPNGEDFVCELVDAFGHSKFLRSHSSKRVPHSNFVCEVRPVDCDTKEIKLLNNSYITTDVSGGVVINDMEDWYWSFNDNEKVCMLKNYTFTTKDSGSLKITLFTSTNNNSLIDSVSQTIDLSYVPSRGSIFDTIENGQSYSFAGRTLTHSGTYNDTLVSYKGCDSVVTLYLYVKGGQSLNTAELDKVSVYPNPAGNILVVSGCEVVSSAIFDGAGKIVLSFGKENKLNLSKLPAGIYTIRIETPSGDVLRKFVKQ